MTPEEWQRIEGVVDQVLELPIGDRSILVARLCGGDAELEDAVTEFLRDCDVAATLYEGLPLTGAADLLESPTRLPEPPSPLAPGARLGPYRVIRVLGYGGMGAVYLAERADGVFEKKFALKVLRGGVDSEAAIQRFRDERQMLAQLEHPNIARLHDGGITEDGLPFFVMEYVRGEPIDVYADHHRLTIDQRLKLFEQVCAAVSYAHRHLVVHQDLKPSNILVTPKGQVKLVDFGIGKVLREGTGAEGDQGSGGRLTLQYASPEQVSGGVTGTTTDVYSLGVVLYELMCGRSPYGITALNPRVLQAKIVLNDPAAPSVAVRAPVGEGAVSSAPEWLAEARGSTIKSLHRRLSGDVDAILLKVLKKDPKDRYASADDLWGDIARHLADFPVRARTRTRGYVASRFLGRHRIAVGSGMLVLFALSVAGVTAARAAVAEQEALEGQAEVRLFSRTVLSQFEPEAPPDAVAGAVEQIVSKIEALEFAPRESADLMVEVADDAFERELWPIAAAMYQSADGVIVNGVESLAPERMAPVRGLGQVRLQQYRTTAAIPWFREALKVADATGVGDVELARTLNDLGFSLAAAVNNNADEVQADTARKREFLEEALGLYERSLGLVAQYPDSIDLRVGTHEGLGEVFFASGDFESAAEEYERAVQLLRDSDRDTPRLGELSLWLGQTHKAWGHQLRAKPDTRHAEALRHFDLAHDHLVEARNQLEQFRGQRHPTVAAVALELGQNAFARCDFSGAEEWYSGAVDSWTNRPSAIQRAYAQHSLGVALLALGRRSDAHEALTAALSRYRLEPGTSGYADDVADLLAGVSNPVPGYCRSEGVR